MYSSTPRSADSALHTPEVIGSELMAHDIQMDNFGVNLYYLNCKKIGQLTTRKTLELWLPDVRF